MERNNQSYDEIFNGEVEGNTIHYPKKPKHFKEDAELTKVLLDPSVLKYKCLVKLVAKLSVRDKKRSMVPDISSVSEISHLSQTVIDMFDRSEEFDLKLKVGNLSAGKNAQTGEFRKKDGRFEILITLDKQYLRRGTKLALARTLIHESMHAFLKFEAQKNYTSELSNLLRKYQKKWNYNEDISEHMLMSNYADAIAHSLAAWDNHRLHFKYYQAMSWSGKHMRQSPVFNKLSQEMKDLVLKVEKAEGHSNLKYNKDETKSEPCTFN